MLSKRVSVYASVAALAVLVAGCSSARVVSVPPSRPTTLRHATTTTTQPPAVVNGIPLRRLAELVRAPAAAWGEPHPFNIRAAVGSDRAANNLMGRYGETYNFGETARAYVVALDGHFSCELPRCSPVSIGVQGPSEGPTQPPTTTTTPSAVPVSTMLLTFDPNTLQEVGGFRVVDHEVDMNKLGRVYSLDGYR
ncbi:MAG: hypothetical protein ACLPVY_24825 [Acidimicrobiia bacterium]